MNWKLASQKEKLLSTRRAGRDHELAGRTESTLIRDRRDPCDATHCQEAGRQAQWRDRCLEGGRASVNSGSGASPSPKLANRWLNSESSTGSSAASAVFGWLTTSPVSIEPRPSATGGISGSGSVGIRRIASDWSSAELRDLPSSASRMEPQILPSGGSRAGLLTTHPFGCAVLTYENFPARAQDCRRERALL
jgi:hypothetical protein